MVATSELGALRLGRSGALLGIDAAGARMLGYPSVHAARQPPVLPADETATALRAIGDNRALAFSGSCRRVDGVLLPCRFAAFPHPEADEVRVLFAPVQPPAHTLAPDQHVHSAQFLDRLVDCLPNPVFVKDEQHRWVLLNDAYCRFMGNRREQLLGRSDFDFFPRDEAEVFWAKDDLVFASGGTNENEERFTDASGRPHVILTRKTVLGDVHGKRFLVGVITDITERKQLEQELRRSHDELDRRVAERTAELARANTRLEQELGQRQRTEEQLRRSEAELRQMAEWMPAIVWSARPDGSLDYINLRGPELVGAPAEAGLGQGWLDFVHPDDRPRVRLQWAGAVRGGSVFESEYRLRRRDGVWRWHLVRALAWRDAERRVVRWFGTATDIEEQKHTQHVMQVENRRKSDFLALLSHELRNPLTPVRHAAGLLRRSTPPGAPSERAVALIERQVAHMARLIDDLLDVSRIARGKILLQKQPTDVAAVVRAAVEDRRELLHARGLRLETRLPDVPVWMQADGARLAQAVGNLLDNAQKYTDAGGLISVELDARPDAVSVAVGDTGIGMDAETLAHLFEPFVQAPGGASRRRGGLGLGLALVKNLMELHDGRVEARSEGPGRGSLFRLWLPRGPADAAHAHPEPRPRPQARRQPRRVLVIEDNPDVAESLRLMLEYEGHEVEVAASGEEGVARAHQLRPDVILSDIGLPGISGYEVARTLRADPALESAHLIAITGYGQAEDRELALRSGFEFHLTKPFDHDALERLLAAAG